LAAKSKGMSIDVSKQLTWSFATPLYPDPDFARAVYGRASSELMITPFTAASGEMLYDFAVPVLRRSQPQSLIPSTFLEAEETQQEVGKAGDSSVEVYGVVQIGLSVAKMELALHTAIWNVALITIGIIMGGLAAIIVLVGCIVTLLRSLA